MKARAVLLTFLICLISLAGFGNTTTDLAQNSIAVIVHDDDVASVVNYSDTVENVMNSKFNDVSSIPILIYDQAFINQNFGKKENSLKEYAEVFYSKSKFFILPDQNYKNPRDGLSCV